MSNSTEHEAEATHVVGYATFIKVWVALVALTGALVVLSSMRNPNMALNGRFPTAVGDFKYEINR